MASRVMKRFVFAAVALAARAMGFILLRRLAAPGAGEVARQNFEWLIKNWQTEDDLPENPATGMVQTLDGHLWFGTFNDLVRFDAVKFTVFDPQNTRELPSSSIVNLYPSNAKTTKEID